MASILIIEDDVVDLMAIKRKLVPLNKHQFTYASSLKEALELLVNHHYDLIFTDYYLGDGIATEISCTKTPIILMTGMAEMPDPTIAHRFATILIKDMEQNHLHQIIYNIQTRFNQSAATVCPSPQQSAPLQQLSVSYENDPSFLNEMLLELKNQFQLALSYLNQGNTDTSKATLFNLAHTVKSQFSLGGFAQEAKVAGKLEQIIQDKEVTSEMIDPMIKALQSSIQHALAIIEKKLEEI